jgi:hypothetical protein
VFLFHHGNPHAAKPATFQVFRFYRNNAEAAELGEAARRHE